MSGSTEHWNRMIRKARDLIRGGREPDHEIIWLIFGLFLGAAIFVIVVAIDLFWQVPTLFLLVLGLGALCLTLSRLPPKKRGDPD